LIAVLAATLVFGGWLFVQAKINAETISSTDFCPTSGPRSTAVVVIDATDPFDPVEARALESRVARSQGDIERGGRLELYMVAPVENEPLEMLLGLCNPGRPEEASPWRENPRLVERRWREGFAEAVQKAVRRALRSEKAATSPIINSIRSVAVTAFSPVERAGNPKRLLLISDLLENTSLFSVYRSQPDATRFLGEPMLRQMLPALEGVEVELRIIDRGHARQTPEVARFWEELIAAGGGEVVSRGPLIGIAG
jgi:hypothetical protein